jgi:hypothetical protein
MVNIKIGLNFVQTFDLVFLPFGGIFPTSLLDDSSPPISIPMTPEGVQTFETKNIILIGRGRLPCHLK